MLGPQGSTEEEPEIQTKKTCREENPYGEQQGKKKCKQRVGRKQPRGKRSLTYMQRGRRERERNSFLSKRKISQKSKRVPLKDREALELQRTRREAS
jgi:hypothetical protein